MGAWFADSLWVIGFFMVSCRGFDKWDERAGRFAGVFALGVALIPMDICGVKFGWVQYRGWLHWICAALLFIDLALMCLLLSTKTDSVKPTPKKLRRNQCYVAFGYAIFACIALIGVHSLLRTFRPVADRQSGLLQARILAGVGLRLSLRYRLARQRRNLLVHSGLNDEASSRVEDSPGE